MAYEVRPNTGSLFKNDKKEADTHPDYKGSGLIEGVGEVWLDAWINTSANGTKYMALKFKRKDTVTGGAPVGSSRPAPAGFDDLDDSVPFATANPALERRIG